jgi:DNA primase
MQISSAEYILLELFHDELNFVNPINQLLLDEVIHQLRQDVIPGLNFFIQHSNPIISQLAIQLAEDNYTLSENWDLKYGIKIDSEGLNVKKTIEHALYAYKEKRLRDMILELKESLKNTGDENDISITLSEIKKMESFKSQVNKLLGRIITGS